MWQPPFIPDPWGPQFMQQYLHTHSQLMNWFQNVHSGATKLHYGADPLSTSYLGYSNDNCTSHCNHNRHTKRENRISKSRGFNSADHSFQSDNRNQEDGYTCDTRIEDMPYEEEVYEDDVVLQRPKKRINKNRSSIKKNYEFEKEEMDEEEFNKEEVDEEEIDEDEDDDIKLEFDATPFLAMRAAKSKEEKEEEFEFVDSVEDERFVYMQLNEAKFDDIEYEDDQPLNEPMSEDKMRSTLYGSEANTIAALETSMVISFQHNASKHLPSLWPVLPLKLS